MSQHLVRFSKPKEDRSKFVNDILAKSVGKTEAQIIKTAEKLGLKNPKGFLRWETGEGNGDFTFFSFGSGQLTFGPDNAETCLLVDKLIELQVPMGNLRKLGTIVGEWHAGEKGQLVLGVGGRKKLRELLLRKLQ